MYTIRESDEGEGFKLQTVGHFDPDGAWEPIADFNNRTEALAFINYLNGGEGRAFVGPFAEGSPFAEGRR